VLTVGGLPWQASQAALKPWLCGWHFMQSV